MTTPLALQLTALADDHVLDQQSPLIISAIGRARHQSASEAFRHAALLAEQDESAGYRELADLIDNLFNPPDESEDAEISILLNAVTAAAEFIADRPCVCPIGTLDALANPCKRCVVLGRICDVKEQR